MLGAVKVNGSDGIRFFVSLDTNRRYQMYIDYPDEVSEFTVIMTGTTPDGATGAEIQNLNSYPDGIHRVKHRPSEPFLVKGWDDDFNLCAQYKLYGPDSSKNWDNCGTITSDNSNPDAAVFYFDANPGSAAQPRPTIVVTLFYAGRRRRQSGAARKGAERLGVEVGQSRR